MSRTFLDELTHYVSGLDWARREGLILPLHWIVSTNAGAQLDDNVILFGLPQGGRDPVLAVKVPRLRGPNVTLQNEFECLSELWNRMGNEAPSVLPEPIAFTSLDGQPALLLSYVPGELPWGRGGKAAPRGARATLALAIEAAGRLRLVHERTATALAEEERLPSDLEAKARCFCRAFQLAAEEKRALDELTCASGRILAGATHRVMNQGDFWSGNLLRPRGRGGLVILDWQMARWSADASLDVYFFIVEAALAAARHAPPDERARRAARKLLEWRPELVPAYLAAYGAPAGWGLLPPRLGMMLCCLEKAVRSRLLFGLSHPHDGIWRMLFTELAALPDDADGALLGA